MREKSEELNYTQHWVRIKLEGVRVERLLTLAVKNEMILRNLSYRDETEVYLNLSFKDYQHLKKLAGHKFKFTIVSEGGTHYKAARLKRRKLLFIGILFFMVVVLWQSLFIKEIDVIGCQSIPEDEIRAVLKEEKLYEGCLKKFNCDEIEKTLFRRFKQIVWARVAYDGSFAVVEIAETDNPMPEKKDKSFYCDIIAKKDCYIEQILPYKGENLVEKDDFVRKGDILISGTVPYESTTYESETEGEQEYYVHAEGKITGIVPYYFTFYMEPDGDYDLAHRMLEHWIKENIPKNAQIVNKDLNFDKKKNIIKVYGTVVSREEVGKEKEIIIDESKPRIEENPDS